MKWNMEYGNMLSSEDKILTQTCRNLKDFMPEDFLRNAPTKNPPRNTAVILKIKWHVFLAHGLYTFQSRER